MRVDDEFAGAYDKDSSEDISTVHSRTGFIIKHANCPMTWNSKLQTEIELSKTEDEHVVLYTDLKEAITTIQLM